MVRLVPFVQVVATQLAGSTLPAVTIFLTISNEPGGQRWGLSIDDVVDMFIAQVKHTRKKGRTQ